MTTQLSLVLLQTNGLPKTDASQTTLNQILSDVFVIIGAVAILMIVIAGLRYIMARGTPEKITQAKNMILYSVIGLILAASAYSIVNLVLSKAG
jgi:hypothetical protein